MTGKRDNSELEQIDDTTTKAQKNTDSNTELLYYATPWSPSFFDEMAAHSFFNDENQRMIGLDCKIRINGVTVPSTPTEEEGEAVSVFSVQDKTTESEALHPIVSKKGKAAKEIKASFSNRGEKGRSKSKDSAPSTPTTKESEAVRPIEALSSDESSSAPKGDSEKVSLSPSKSILHVLRDSTYTAAPLLRFLAIGFHWLPHFKNGKIKSGYESFHSRLILIPMAIFFIAVTCFARAEINFDCRRTLQNWATCYACNRKSVNGYVSWKGLIPVGVGLIHLIMVKLFKRPFPSIWIMCMCLYIAFAKVAVIHSPYITVYPWTKSANVELCIPVTRQDNIILFLIDPYVFFVCLFSLLSKKIYNYVEPVFNTLLCNRLKSFIEDYNQSLM